ncbi:MAG TPA: caspase family protein [Nostocaceae cyanobacterium]|nr:caspase family protein [Nostocaceae cyanobacterium]
MNRDALVIGINRYPYLKDTPTSEAQHLTLPARDAEAIAQLLHNHGNFTVRRLPESLIDGKMQVDPQQLVTAEQLENAIVQLFQPEGDRIPHTALLFFAGHGWRDKPVGDVIQGYLETSDANPRKNIWGVSLHRLRQILKKSPIKQQVVFLNCCHSGELFNFSLDDLQLVESDKIRFFVTASREDENAYSSPNGKHGALTEILLKGLDPRRTSEGIVNSINLKEFIENATIQVPQKPLVSNGSSKILLTTIPEKKHILEQLEESTVIDDPIRLNWQCIHTLTDHADIIKSVAISPDGKMIASGSLDHTIKLWDLDTGKLLKTITQHSGAVTCVAFSQNGQTLASSSANPDGTIKLWDIPTGTLQTTLKVDDWIVLSVWSIALSPDGQTLVSSHHPDSSVKIWDLKTQTLRHTLRGHVWEVNSVAFSSDGKTVASGSSDSNIKLWNICTGRQIYNLNGPANSHVGLVKSFFSDNIVYTVAFSPDGQTLASGGEKQPIKLWRLSNGELKTMLTRHSTDVYTVAFSPDGKTLASGSADGTIRIWDLYTGEPTFNLGHSDSVYSLAFSPNGQMMVSGSKDKTIKVWKLV